MSSLPVSLTCDYVGGAGEYCSQRTVVSSGQRLYCARHHISMMSRGGAYSARADAYDADPELRAAWAAYDTALATAGREANAAVPEPVPYDIPLAERTTIRLSNLDDGVVVQSIRHLCAPYGWTHNVVLPCDATTHKPNGTARVTLETHEQAACALSALNGEMFRGKTLAAEWVARVLPQKRSVPKHVYERAPAVVAALAAVGAAKTAARERQTPGILAEEAHLQAEEDAEYAAYEEEERRDQAMRDEEERQDWQRTRQDYRHHNSREFEDDGDDN